jgi:hypothetical protein
MSMLRILFSLLLLSPFAFAQVPPEKALSTMKAADGLQVELFAAEPMVINPTNMDIDPLGRVWITEAVNYRTKLHNKPLNRPEGDRIVILTDTKGVGKADEMTVFYQGKELYGPLHVTNHSGECLRIYVCGRYIGEVHAGQCATFHVHDHSHETHLTAICEGGHLISRRNLHGHFHRYDWHIDR